MSDHQNQQYINLYTLYAVLGALCGLGCFDASELRFVDTEDARFEVGLGLGLVLGDLPVSLDVSAGFVVFASAVGENEEPVIFNAAKHVLNGGVGVCEMHEEDLERFARRVVGFFDCFDFLNNGLVFKGLSKNIHDLFASA